MEIRVAKEIQASYIPEEAILNIKGAIVVAPYIEAVIGDDLGLQENFIVLFISRSGNLLGHRTISKGGMCATIVPINTICKYALLCNAASVIIAHNHPSGNLRPSPEDIRLTRKIKSALELLEINLLDHIIVGPQVGHYMSFADEGKLYCM